MNITVDGIRPPIWRRVVVAGDVTLAHLHDVLQVAMGWEGCHLHSSWIDGVRYGTADMDLDLDEVDESKLSVAEAFAATRRGVDEHDFGDSWEHQLLVEKTDVPLPHGVAACIAGKRACPPEDCGGIWGYADLLEALADPAHEEHEELLEWAGEDFDPEAFELEAVNARLARLPGRTGRAR